jgi:hypothetical protein
MALADNKVIARDMHTECCSEKKEEEAYQHLVHNT